jgi:hypothetical protein
MTCISPISLELVSDINGFLDYDVRNHPTLRRAAVPVGIRIGEQFNVYHGESSKSGATWLGGVEKSLRAWLEVQASALKAKNEVAEKLLAKLALIGRVAEGGLYGGQIYCAGVPDACLLGSQLGQGFGIMGWELVGNQKYIVFREARVSC